MFRIRNFYFILVLSLLILPTFVNSQNNILEDPPVTFNLYPNYSMKVQATGDLIWNDGTNSTVKLAFQASNLPNDNVSSIEISLLSFTYVMVTNNNDKKGTAVDFSSTVYERSLTNVSESINLNKTLTTPTIPDLFFLNITIYARTVGNFTQGQALTYVLRFPQNTAILVNRQQVVAPLINLYGFPPSSFFQKWIPIYLIMSAILLIPAFIYYGDKVITKIKSRSSSPNTTTESNQGENK